jgi:hypothetical protein
MLRFVRELDGNDEEQYDHYLKDAGMYTRGRIRCGGHSTTVFISEVFMSLL